MLRKFGTKSSLLEDLVEAWANEAIDLRGVKRLGSQARRRYPRTTRLPAR